MLRLAGITGRNPCRSSPALAVGLDSWEDGMMKLSQFALVLALAVGGWSICNLVQADSPAKGVIRVGTFDSRAVAVAYIRSELFGQSLKETTKELQDAKSAGNQAKVKQLESELKATQERAHLQGFGTASVANILEQIKDQLPAIAKEAGVDVLISKWDVAYQASSTELVDVTDQMIKPFKPNEKTLQIIQDLKKHEPVSLEELKKAKGL